MVEFKNYLHRGVHHLERRQERVLMEVVYATDINATNIHNWSGLAWYYRKMLEEAGCDVTLIDSSSMPHPFFLEVKKHLMQKIGYKLYSPRFSTSVSKHYANRIHEIVTP